MEAPKQHLGWVQDPLALPRLKQTRPAAEDTPTIVGEYRTRPKGGRAENPSGPWLRCCYCAKENHWHGYVYTNSTGDHYLIGNKCAKEHYGDTNFIIAKRNYHDLERRAGLLLRVRRLRDLMPGVILELDQFAANPFITTVDKTHVALQAAAPDMVLRLNSALNAGGKLQAHEPARDQKGRTVAVPVDLGAVAGVAIIRGGNRSAIRKIAEGLKALDLLINEAERQTNNTLIALFKNTDDLLAAAVALHDTLSKSHQLFSTQNIARLERWAKPLNRWFSIGPGKNGAIKIWNHQVGVSGIAPVHSAKLPRLRCTESLITAASSS